MTLKLAAVAVLFLAVVNFIGEATGISGPDRGAVTRHEAAR